MTDSRYWSKDFTVTFLEKYREFPCLWKIKSKEYLNKNLKTAAYDELTELCKTVCPDANREFVVKKIQGLRGSFRKELNKVLASKRSGSGQEQIYEPTLWYYELLLFIVDQETPSNNLYNIAAGSESYNEDTNIEQNSTDDVSELEEFISTQESINPRTIAWTTLNPTKKKRPVADRQVEFMKACTQALSQSMEISEYDAIGINVAAKLKKMENNQRIYADLLISKILSNGLLSTLTSITDIYEPIETNFQNLYENQNTTFTTTGSQISYDVQGQTTFNYSLSSCPNSNSTSTYELLTLPVYKSDHSDSRISP